MEKIDVEMLDRYQKALEKKFGYEAVQEVRIAQAGIGLLSDPPTGCPFKPYCSMGCHLYMLCGSKFPACIA